MTKRLFNAPFVIFVSFVVVYANKPALTVNPALLIKQENNTHV